MLNPLQCHPGNPATVSMFQPSWTKPICTCLNCREWFPPFYTTSPTQHHFWVTQGHARVILLTVIVTLSLLNKFRVRLSVSMITCRPVCYWKTAPLFQPFGKLFSELLFSRAVAEADELPWPQTSPCINCGENVLKIKSTVRQSCQWCNKLFFSRKCNLPFLHVLCQQPHTDSAQNGEGLKHRQAKTESPECISPLENSLSHFSYHRSVTLSHPAPAIVKEYWHSSKHLELAKSAQL